MIENKEQLKAARQAYKQVTELQVDILANMDLSVPMRGYLAAGIGGIAEGILFSCVHWERENDIPGTRKNKDNNDAQTN